MAVVSVSRPWLIISRPRSAAWFARSRPSRAFSPRYSRVSRPLAGAYNSARAAPLTAPRMNANRMLPAPDPSSFAMLASAHRDALRDVLPRFGRTRFGGTAITPSQTSEHADSNIQIPLRIFLDVRDQRPEIANCSVHVLI